MASFKKSAGDKVFESINVIIILFITLLTLYPVYYCLINSFNDAQDALHGAIYLYPRVFSLKNYLFVFREKEIYSAILISVLRTVIGTSAAILMTSLFAYGLSKKELKYRKIYMVFGTFTIFASGSLIPTYMVFKSLHLIDTFFVYFVADMVSFYYVILFISFYKSLPAAIEESARIDGAGNFTILFKVVLPNCYPIIATLALFIGVWHWNDYFYSAFYITNKNLMTLAGFLQQVLNEGEMQQAIKRAVAKPQNAKITLASVRYATLIVAILPVAVAYPFVQSFFVKGITLGAVKE